MKTDEKIIEDLKIINDKAKYMGIKIIMVRHLIEPHINNKKLLYKVLESTKDTEIHNLILTACPKLEEIFKKET
jgi:DNA-directed RNA polymerase subunit I